MKQRFHDGDEAMRPDCISYSIILNAYAQKMMTEDAESLLWEMVDDYVLYNNQSAEPRTRKGIDYSQDFFFFVHSHLFRSIHIRKFQHNHCYVFSIYNE